ncbi:DUF4440 domain-containing protein [Gilvibacter sp. SZ-19]|uniref:YybH family protein n=1 Tax=unclassified Gilvibacter TaxID=2625242 RepID=UPI000B3BE6DE|nr:nuclear transport factor 2 family protein [Gilvibacter sp. SZ-19]ARV12262.1 DUF4440 domain-containing protein [Gilvibacter sp. SZ-19]
MNRRLFLCCFYFFITGISLAQSIFDRDKAAIIQVMQDQSKAWSAHDLEGFMAGYWKSDSLKFYGSGGLVKGWQATLDRYKKSYPTADHSGTLKFTIDDVSPAGTDSYTVMGRYHLTRKVGDANGVFLVVFRKINGQWKIVADMSC